MKNKPLLRITLLVFDNKHHRFHPYFGFVGEEGGYDHDLTLEQVRLLTDNVPSVGWWQEYCQWLSGAVDKEGLPVFPTVTALHDFNDTGYHLVDSLRKELETSSPREEADCNAQVEDFVPLYSNIQVGDTWYDVKDGSYGFVIPIQQLPVSDQLKSRLQVWRLHKTQQLTQQLDDPQYRRCLSEECHELEEHILWELSVRAQDVRGASRSAEPATTSATTTPSQHSAISAISVDHVAACMGQISVDPATP
jgi:hypothetical protein